MIELYNPKVGGEEGETKLKGHLLVLKKQNEVVLVQRLSGLINLNLCVALQRD